MGLWHKPWKTSEDHCKKTPCFAAGGNRRQLLCPSNHGNNFFIAFVGRGLNFGIEVFLDCILAVDISPLTIAHWVEFAFV